MTPPLDVHMTHDRDEGATVPVLRKPPLSTSEAPGRGLNARLGLFFAVLFVLIGIQTPFFPVWLAARGLGPGEIGLVLAAPMVVRFFAVPVITRLADRHNALRGTLILMSWATLAGYAGIALSDGFVGIMLAVAFMAIWNAPTMALADAYALRALEGRRHDYGPVRLWGSAAFVAANLGAGYLLDLIDAGQLILLMIGACFVIALAGMTLPQLAVQHAPAQDAGSALGFLSQRAFVCVILAASLVQASHSLYYGFSAIAWSAAGFGGVSIGALWAIGVVAEIVLFAWSGRFPLRVGPVALLLIGAAGAVLRWTAMAFDPPDWSLPLLQLLHGLSFGATHLGTIGFLAAAAPARFGATVQGYFYVALSATLALGMSVSGLLYGAFGSGGYAAMALAAAAGGFVALFAAPGVVRRHDVL